MRTLECFLRLITLAAGFAVGQACAQELALIVNKSNPVENLSAAQLRKVLLGEQSQWPNGKQVMVLLRSPGSPERSVPLQVACGMTETEFDQHFLHANFVGGTASQPKALGSSATLRQLVTTLPGAIGIVALADVTDTVKIVKYEGLAPGDAAYKLKK